jgi:hypothetical protein
MCACVHMYVSIQSCHTQLSSGETQDSKSIQNIQKKIIRMMVGIKKRVSCRELFKKFNTLPLASEFLLSLLLFIVDNMETFQTSSDIRSINTRHKQDLHVSNVNLKSYWNQVIEYSST